MLSQKQIKAINKAFQANPSFRMLLEQELKDDIVWPGDIFEEMQVDLAINEIEITALQTSAPNTPKFVSQIIDTNSPNQIELLVVPSGSAISSIKAIVNNSFNTEASLTIGTLSDHDKFLSVNESDLMSMFTYVTFSTETFNLPTAVYCFFNANASTVGEVEVQLTYA